MALELLVLAVLSVTPDGFESANDPQVAIGADARIHVVYGMKDAIYLSTSSDRGKSFAPPVKIGEAGKLSLGMRRGPRIAVGKNGITVTAIYGELGGGRDGDILAFRSKDGKAWSGPFNVTDVKGAAREGLHAMAVSPDGTLACSWLDLRENGTTLYLSTSKDGGATWSANRLAYAPPSGTICECCHPSLAFDRTGALTLMFRNLMAGNRDMYVIHTRDFRSFSPATRLGHGSWQLNACPMDGGGLAFDSSGNLTTIWRREGTIYSSGTGAEVNLGEGRNPWVASGGKGTYRVWTVGNAIMAGTTKLADNGRDPVVATSPDGRFAIAAWSDRGIRASVLAQ